MPNRSKSKKFNSNFTNVKDALKRNKFFIFSVVVLLLAAGIPIHNKYKDWDNAQMIKGLSRDFPILVEQIERETGLELEIESNCMTTQEKFSDGVSTCEYQVSKNQLTESQRDAYKEVIKKQTILGVGSSPDYNPDAHWYTYRNKDSCNVEPEERIYISCITAVRDANKDNIQELLNHD